MKDKLKSNCIEFSGFKVAVKMYFPDNRISKLLIIRFLSALGVIMRLSFQQDESIKKINNDNSNVQKRSLFCNT